MIAKEISTICAVCKGHVTKRMEGISFRQLSDKGYIHCHVTLLIGTCDSCHTKSTEEDADEVFDAAFKLEYDKLP